MGMLVEGKWQDKGYDTKSTGGKFVRQASQFTHEIGSDGVYQPESGRYHLYVSYACPWAHRTLIMRELKGLSEHIDVSVVHPDMLGHGWQFGDYPGATGDKLYGFQFAHQLYTRHQSDITTRVTVPVLWDKKTSTIVNNESAQILRIFNSAFNEVTGNTVDYYPEQLRQQIDEINDVVYEHINNGVYKAGFATRQDAYEEAVDNLFASLDRLEKRLAKQRYLVSGQLTEADWRLFTTLIRFDAVYHGHFKCNVKRITDYPNLSNYLRDLYQMPGIAGTVNMQHIKRHYYFSHKHINPTQIVPTGPELHFNAPHNRSFLR
ncbi:MAG: glutathione S-transferase family protein [Aestuariibacter sp.]